MLTRRQDHKRVTWNKSKQGSKDQNQRNRDDWGAEPNPSAKNETEQKTTMWKIWLITVRRRRKSRLTTCLRDRLKSHTLHKSKRSRALVSARVQIRSQAQGTGSTRHQSHLLSISFPEGSYPSLFFGFSRFFFLLLALKFPIRMHSEPKRMTLLLCVNAVKQRLLLLWPNNRCTNQMGFFFIGLSRIGGPGSFRCEGSNPTPTAFVPRSHFIHVSASFVSERA